MANKISKLCFTLIIVFFALAHRAHAGFEITEIMYDLDGTDTNREWVEVKNTGASPDDLSRWFFFSDNTKHALVAQGDTMVPAGGYAVIVQNPTNFRADWPNFSGLLFDSSWTGFNNDGETIALKDPDLNLVSEVTFASSQGASGDGNSLQKINSTWTAGVPTPGVANQADTGGGGGGGGGTPPPSTTPTTTPPPVKKKEVEVPKIKTNIITKSNTVFAGIPFQIDASTTGLVGETLTSGRFIWNFGDGTTKVEAEHMPFEQLYEYPGQYVITLSYYRAWTGPVQDATDRVTITVVPSGITISSVGKIGDPYVEIENKSTYEVDLSSWVIQGSVQSFVIPEGTIILPNQKLRLSGKATSLTLADVNSVILKNSHHELAATYPSNTIPRASSKSGSSSYNPKPSSSPAINLNDLGASASDAKSVKGLPGNIFAWAGLVGVIVIGLASIFLLRRKSVPDYIEKEISASDMELIE